MRRPQQRYIGLLLPLAACPLVAAPALAGYVHERGSFAAEVQRHKSLAFGSDTGLYVPPTASEGTAYYDLAAMLWSGAHLSDTASSAAVANAAGALGYEFVRFHDTDTGQVYHGLREQLVNGQQSRGWGTYYVNHSAITNATAQSPHVLFDMHTEEMGGKIFQRAAARGYLLAGAHRNVNGFGTGDVCRLPGCVYHEVHKAWSGPTGQTTAWQIHGFAIGNHAAFPPGTDAVLSTGGGQVTAQMLDLDARLEAADWESYAWNTLGSSHPLNVQINGSLPGSTFSSLAATTNDQGSYSRGIGGTFMHVELEQSIRFDPAHRDDVSWIIARSMAATEGWAAGFKRWDAGGGGGQTGVWTSSTNWASNGLPGSGDVVVFDNNNVGSLPPAMTLSGANMGIRGFVWNSSNSGSLASATAGATHSTLSIHGDANNPDRPLIAMYPLAEGSTFTFSGVNTAGGSGVLRLNLMRSGAINVAHPDATLRIEAQVLEAASGVRLEKTGPGLLVLTSTSNAFTGGMTISGGTVQTSGFTQLGPAPTSPMFDFLTLDGGTYRYSGSGIGIHVNRGITVSDNAGTIEVRNASATLDLRSPISGPGTLNKTGAGTATIGYTPGGGANPGFTGVLSIREGIVIPTADGALGAPSSGTEVHAGATLGMRDNVDYATPEPLELRGAGAGGTGALWNIAGDNRFGGPVTLAANATTRVEPGSSLELSGGISGTATLTIDGGGTLSAASYRVDRLNLQANTTAAVLPGRSTDGTSRVRTLSVNASARLDLNDQDLIVDYSGASPLNAIRSLIVNGYNGGAWNGTGITSTSAAAGDTALGYAASTELFGTFPAVFSGQNVDSTSVLLRYTLLGDATMDGQVTISDFSALAANFNGPGNWTKGDFNYDGTVGIADFALLAGNFNRMMPLPPARVVPEAGVGMVLLASLTFWRPRERGQRSQS